MILTFGIFFFDFELQDVRQGLQVKRIYTCHRNQYPRLGHSECFQGENTTNRCFKSPLHTLLLRDLHSSKRRTRPPKKGQVATQTRRQYTPNPDVSIVLDQLKGIFIPTPLVLVKASIYIPCKKTLRLEVIQDGFNITAQCPNGCGHLCGQIFRNEVLLT